MHSLTRVLFTIAGLLGLFFGLVPDHASALQLKTERFERKPIGSDIGVGSDGDLTVTAANTQINNYALLAADVAAGSQTFSVTEITDLHSGLFGDLAVGDLLMLIQMQGASINTPDTVAYGGVSNLNGAGLYELVKIAGISGNTITVNNESGCINGLRNAYSVAGRTQVVRVPQLNNLTVNVGASIVPTTWDGSRGGVAAVQVLRFATINGSIDASADGFRGGTVKQTSAFPGGAGYRTTVIADGAEKAESIAGYQAEYDLLDGRYGRGAPANGGGGANPHKSGGGGGANGNNGNAWTGQGVMPATPAAAWALDPGYIANGNTFTNSSGGGRGGYTYSAADQDPHSIPPGDIGWGGSLRREVGGLGGRPVDNNPANRVFLGGGGGAGDSNNNTGSSGGRGGGIVFLQAGSVTGTGSIESNGAAADDTVAPHNDAPGGGGAGGTVVVSSFNYSGVPITANGGNGGSQFILGASEGEGPGGGGGGGYIAIRFGSPTRTTNGGIGGTTTSNAMNQMGIEFPRNGSTNGATGQNNATVTTVPVCLAPSAAPVSVQGRVTTASGWGIPRAYLTLTDAQGVARHAMTNPFGYFRFSDLSAGEAVVISVTHKRYSFAEPTQVVLPVDSVTEIEFTAEP